MLLAMAPVRLCRCAAAPFLIVGTAGTVNTGAFDRLEAIAELARAEGLWFHVDGAFGAWAKIAGHPWHELVRDIEHADSLAFDFHKWISVPYDAGCVLIRDAHCHRSAFAGRPNYLTAGARGLAAGDPWPCDYGIDLSRGFRALKVWITLRHYGLAELGRMIAKNCRSAAHLGKLVAESELFELAAPVSLNICCFCLKGSGHAYAFGSRYSIIERPSTISTYCSNPPARSCVALPWSRSGPDPHRPGTTLGSASPRPRSERAARARRDDLGRYRLRDGPSGLPPPRPRAHREPACSRSGGRPTPT